jgi:hypothetical protein
LFLPLSSLFAQTTYTWVGGAGSSVTPVDYTVAANWSSSGTTRTAPATNDILVFDLSNVDGASTAGSIFVTNIPAETIGQLQIIQSGGYSTARSVTFAGTAITYTISGDLIIGGLNTRLNDGGYTISIGGTLQYLGTGSAQVHASANYTPGSLSGKLLFTGATPTFGVGTSGTNIGVGNIEISSSTTLTISSTINALTVNGNLNINSGGKVSTNNKTLQLTSGNPNSAGTSTAGVGGTISGSGVVVGSGSGSLNINQVGVASSAQVIGTVNFDPTSTATSTINNISFTRALGVLTIGTANANTLTIPGSISFSANGAGTINDGGNNIALAGSIVNSATSVCTFTGTGGITMNGGSRYIGNSILQNITLAASTIVTLTGSVTINGALKITGAGGLALGASNYSLTMANGTSITRSSTGGITNSGTGSLIFGTTANDRVTVNIGTTSCSSTLELQPVTGGIDSLKVTGGTYTLTSNAIVNKGLTLSGGSLAGAFVITMANGSTITRSGTGTITNTTFQYGSSATDRVNIKIAASVTSSSELTGSTGGIGTLEVASGTYTLNATSTTINTKLLSSGGSITFSAGKTITMANKSIIERSSASGGYTGGTAGTSILLGTSASDTVTLVISATSGTVTYSYEVAATTAPGKIGSILVTGNGGTYALTGVGPTIAGNVYVAVGATFNPAGQTVSFTNNGAIVDIYGTVQTSKGNGIGGSSNSSFNSTTSPVITFYTGSTAEYNATNTGQTVSPNTYYHLKITGNRTTGSGNLTFSSGTVTINGDLTISTNLTGSTIVLPTQNGTIVFGGSGTQNLAFSNSAVSGSASTIVFNNITISSGSTLSSNVDLPVVGSLAGTGTFVGASGTQKISMTGSGKSIAGLTISNLDVNSGGTISVSGTPTTFTGTVNIIGGTLAYGGSATGTFNASSVLNILAAGTVDFNSRPITLKANVSSTAALKNVGTLNNATNVTVQQWVTGQRGYRVLSNPFSTTLSPSTVGSANGITITGASDVKTYDGIANAWTGNVSSIAANTSYSVFIRGLASEVTGLTYSAGPTAFAYGVTGTLNNGTSVSLNQNNTTANDWTIAGNPFAAPVNSSALTGGTAGTPYYVYSMSQNNTGTRVKAGGWVAAASNSNTTTPIPVMGVVAYQAGTGASSTFPVASTSINITNTAQTGLFGEGDATTQLELQLSKDGNYQDKLFVRFDANSTEKGTERMDLPKLNNDVTNIYTITSDNARLAVDARKGIDASIPVGITAPVGKYSFTVASNNFVNASNVYLLDKLTNTKTVLEAGATYSFEITSDASTQGDNRFELGAVKTAIQDVVSNNNFSAKVLGNVVNNMVTLQVKGAKSASVQITLVDIQGKIISTTTSSKEINTVSLASGSGMYLIKVTDGDNSIVNKVVKP